MRERCGAEDSESAAEFSTNKAQYLKTILKPRGWAVVLLILSTDAGKKARIKRKKCSVIQLRAQFVKFICCPNSQKGGGYSSNDPHVFGTSLEKNLTWVNLNLRCTPSPPLFMKKNVENMKEYEEICEKYEGMCGKWIKEYPLLYRLWDLENSFNMKEIWRNIM